MRILAILGLLIAAAALQGCVPAVATGAAAGVLIADDRRTSGAFVDDQTIEIKTSNRIKEKFGTEVHVNVTSYNRNVLLTGEAPTEEAKAQIAAIPLEVPGVRGVSNEIVVAPASSIASRSNDTFITSKVKTRFVTDAAGRFQPNHVKVVTENGVVYLLGLVTRAEADAATEIARTTEGVQKVVKVFEYIDGAQASR